MTTYLKREVIGLILLLLAGCGGGSSDSTQIRLVSIEVSPPNPSIAKGTSQQFTTMGTFSDSTTQDLTASVTWSSLDTAVATVSDTGGNKGLANGIMTGTTTITATDLETGIKGSTNLTVTPAVLVSIAVTPQNSSITRGISQQFTATGTFSDSTTQDISGLVSWTSSDISIATISSATGSEGLSSSISIGSTTITSTDPTTGLNASTTLTVFSNPFQISGGK
ncbi:MAG: Ig-like domain-containing protein [Nitrospiria bacterium]